MKKIAFFIPDLRGGGAEKTVVNLLKEFAKMPVKPDLLVLKKQGAFLDQLPSNINIVEFNKSRMIGAIRSLISYFKKSRPDILISNLSHSNVIALLANKISGTKTKIIAVEHAVPVKTKKYLSKEFVLQSCMRWLYPSASAIVAVADNTSREVENFLKIKKHTIRTIYNPVVDQDNFGKLKIQAPHQWFSKKDFPVLLAAGRFVTDKDFSTLIKAFALVREKQKSKLVILGKGELYETIKDEANSLGISADVLLPGFTENPYAYMSHSDVFVLSSLSEGLPTVLIEAMACGCPVVATNSKGGSAEILENGKFGILVPVSDPVSMADAIINTLENPAKKEELINRAKFFSVGKSAQAYWSLIEEVTNEK